MAREEIGDKPSFCFSTRIDKESITIRREGFTTLKKLHKGQALLFLNPNSPEMTLSEDIAFNPKSVKQVLHQKISSAEHASPLLIPCLFINKDDESETAVDIPFHTISSLTSSNLFQKDPFQDGTHVTVQIIGGYKSEKAPQLMLEFSFLCSHFFEEPSDISSPLSELHLKSFYLFSRERISVLPTSELPSTRHELLLDATLIFYDATTNRLFRNSITPFSEKKESSALESALHEMISREEVLIPPPSRSGYFRILSQERLPSHFIFKNNGSFFIAHKSNCRLSPLDDPETIFKTTLSAPSESMIHISDPFLLSLGNGYYEFWSKSSSSKSFTASAAERTPPSPVSVLVFF